MTIPRDREAHFDPMLIGKYQRRLPGFDDKVISLYTRGMSTREIQGHLEEIYGTEVSLISTVTDAVTAEVAEWQSQPLEPLYPVMVFDAIRVKVRDQGTACNKAVYLALGITPDGRQHFWGYGSTRTRVRSSGCASSNRGVRDILIAVVVAALKPISRRPRLRRRWMPSRPAPETRNTPRSPRYGGGNGIR